MKPLGIFYKFPDNLGILDISTILAFVTFGALIGTADICGFHLQVKLALRSLTED